MRQALIVAVYPDTQTADLVYLDTSQPVGRVQFAHGLASNDGGSWNVPSVPKPSNALQAATPSHDGRQLIALVNQVAGRPIIVGFTAPYGSQLGFSQQDRVVQRHPASGAYTTISPDGSMEVWHPSGSFIRIGTGTHEALARLSPNNTWKEVSDAPQPTIVVSTQHFQLTIATDGTVTMHSDKSIAISAPSGVNITADVAITGNLTATGNIQAGHGGSPIELLHHTHSSSGGTGTGGPPTPGS